MKALKWSSNKTAHWELRNSDDGMVSLDIKDEHRDYTTILQTNDPLVLDEIAHSFSHAAQILRIQRQRRLENSKHYMG